MASDVVPESLNRRVASGRGVRLETTLSFLEFDWRVYIPCNFPAVLRPVQASGRVIAQIQRYINKRLAFPSYLEPSGFPLYHLDHLEKPFSYRAYVLPRFLSQPPSKRKMPNQNRLAHHRSILKFSNSKMPKQTAPLHCPSTQR